jgi:hypothetical protein
MTEMDIETSAYYVHLTRLIVREDIIKFTHRESTKTYNYWFALNLRSPPQTGEPGRSICRKDVTNLRDKIEMEMGPFCTLYGLESFRCGAQPQGYLCGLSVSIGIEKKCDCNI